VGEKKNVNFASQAQLLDALHAGKVGIDTQVQVGGKPATAGRALIAARLPENLHGHVLHSVEPLTKKNVETLLKHVVQHAPTAYPRIVNELKDLGNDVTTGRVRSGFAGGKELFTGATTLGLDDFAPNRAAQEHLVEHANDMLQGQLPPWLTPAQRDHAIVTAYQTAEADAWKMHTAKPTTSSLHQMHAAGIKPSKDQLKQMVLAPVLYTNSQGGIIASPVTRSFAQGLDLGSYWTSLYGARRGAQKKTQEVQEPGYLSKLLQNTAMDIKVTRPDCGTKVGISLPVSTNDVVDRVLSKAVQTKDLHLPAGTHISTAHVSRLRAADPNMEIEVRSPLHCDEPLGVCQHCAGLSVRGHLHPVGTFLGVQAAHAIGERAVQLMLKEFHCLHAATLVLVRREGRIEHTTLADLYDEAQTQAEERGDGESVKDLIGVEVWDRHGWVRARNVRCHPQQHGTSMVLLRTRSGYGAISQDNHPHMLASNPAVCPTCGTYPKRDNDGAQYRCRKCGWVHKGDFAHGNDWEHVEPVAVGQKTHTAHVDRGPAPSPATPPLTRGYLAGIYCAEGSLHITQERGADYLSGFSIGQNAGSAVYEQIHAELIAEYGPGAYGAHARGYRVYGRQRALHYQSTFGRYSRNVGLPAGWSGYPAEWLCSFVAGVFDGDGTLVRTEDSRWLVGRIDTTSWKLAQQLHWILRGVGVKSRVLTIPWRKLSRHQGYAVTFPLTEQARAVLSASHKLRGQVAKTAANRESFETVVDYVRPVRFTSPPLVYDIETESHTYMAGGLWTHNTGGVAGAGSKTLGAFDVFRNLTFLPHEIPNQARLATVSGKVTAIKPVATGTEIHIDGQPHFVPKDALGRALHTTVDGKHSPGWTPPVVGAHVAAGSSLSDPTRTMVNPHDLYEATGDYGRVQDHLVRSIHGIYKDEGVRRIATETLVRAMGNAAEVIHAGDHPHALRGEVMPLPTIKKHNAELIAEGKQPIKFKPVLAGVDMLPLEARTDWISQLQHQRLSQSLADAAALGRHSNIHGAHPIPGLAFGAEFGLNVDHSKKPGYEHLRDVPKHHT
jgi:transcription initiation factor TFIIIB Brf1 subunit/transcription initiation factor TFIIB